MSTRIPAIKKEIKKKDGLSGYTFEEKKRLISYVFPRSSAKNRVYGISTWMTQNNHYQFKADCLFDKSLLGEVYRTDKGWEMEGGYSEKLVLDSFDIFTNSNTNISSRDYGLRDW